MLKHSFESESPKEKKKSPKAVCFMQYHLSDFSDLRTTANQTNSPRLKFFAR